MKDLPDMLDKDGLRLVGFVQHPLLAGAISDTPTYDVEN
jgi:hypothetical protein